MWEAGAVACGLFEAAAGADAGACWAGDAAGDTSAGARGDGCAACSGASRQAAAATKKISGKRNLRTSPRIAEIFRAGRRLHWPGAHRAAAGTSRESRGCGYAVNARARHRTDARRSRRAGRKGPASATHRRRANNEHRSAHRKRGIVKRKAAFR